MKKAAFIRSQNTGHWVGDGFPVHTIFTYNKRSSKLSPFLLLDQRTALGLTAETTSPSNS